MGSVTSTTFPDEPNPTLATYTNVGFDEVGRPEKLFSNRFGWIQVDYSIAGLVTSRSTDVAGGVSRTIGHDVLGRVVEDEVKHDIDFRSKQTFTYAGGLNRVTDLGTAVGLLGSAEPPLDFFSFTYDKQNQIATASGPHQYAASFTYTPAGRLESANVAADPNAPLAPTRNVTYDYGDGTLSDPEAVERLVDVGGGPDVASYTYDESGNALSRTQPAGTWTFVYDGDDQQRKVTAADGTEELYYYDESGSRILAIERDGLGVPQTIRWHFGATEIHYDGAGTETRTLVHDGLGSPQVRIRDKTTVEHLFHDGRGHLLVALDDTGTIKAGFTYGPFGEVLEAIGTPEDFVRRFNGKEFDEVSSLSYYGARYYDPLALGWTQSDPLYRFVPEFAFDEPRRANLYAFTLNNALSFADPEGLDAGLIEGSAVSFGSLGFIDPCSQDPGSWACSESKKHPWVLYSNGKTYGEVVKEGSERVTAEDAEANRRGREVSKRLIIIDPESEGTKSAMRLLGGFVADIYIDALEGEGWFDPGASADPTSRGGAGPGVGKGSSGDGACMSCGEAKRHLKRWDKGTFKTRAESIRYHKDKHGKNMTTEKYLRKASNFKKKGATKIKRADGTTLYRRKSGEFLIELNGKILSYGPAPK